MNSMHEEWERFKGLSYPSGMEPQQERQIKNAFMAGAIITFMGITGLSEVSDDEGVIALDKLGQEAKAYVAEKVKGAGG